MQASEYQASIVALHANAVDWLANDIHNNSDKYNYTASVFTNTATVEPPNKGHFGNGHFVLFSEAVPISEACHRLTI